MKRSGEVIPFDVKDYRLIEYDLKPKSIKTDKWVTLLKSHVTRVLEPEYKAPRLLRDTLVSRSDAIRSYVINERSEEFGEPPKFNEIVGRACEYCYLMGVSLKIWASDSARRVLTDLVSRRVPLKVLIMDSMNLGLDAMINAHIPSEDLESVKRQTERMISYFRSVAAEAHSMEVRTLRYGLPHFQLIVTEGTCLVLQYMFSRGTADSPLQQFPSGSQLHRAFREEFESLWQLNA